VFGQEFIIISTLAKRTGKSNAFLPL